MDAGVDSVHPDRWQAFHVTLTGPASDEQTHEAIATASRAAADRLGGKDKGHAEHQLQAALDESSLGLKAGWKREYPAWRPGSNRAAFIDFLGVDYNRRLHVVETKIGSDTMLVLQGLDYWLWCQGNAEHAASALDADPTQSPVIDFVVAPKKTGGELISIYTAGQVEALHPSIEWQFTAISHPAATGKVAERLAPGQLPEPYRRAGQSHTR